MPCIEKATDMRLLYSNVMTILANRILKLLLNMLRHKIELESSCAQVF